MPFLSRHFNKIKCIERIIYELRLSKKFEQFDKFKAYYLSLKCKGCNTIIIYLRDAFISFVEWGKFFFMGGIFVKKCNWLIKGICSYDFKILISWLFRAKNMSCIQHVYLPALKNYSHRCNADIKFINFQNHDYPISNKIF